jgi:hypothetical protein
MALYDKAIKSLSCGHSRITTIASTPDYGAMSKGSDKDDDKSKEIAKAKYITGESTQAIALAIGKSKRTVERWAFDNGWADLRQVNNQQSRQSNVLSFSQSPKPKNPKPQKPTPQTQSLEIKDSDDLDDLGVVEEVIKKLRISLSSADDRSKGGIAGAIARLIELKRKIQPETVADLVERAIELGIAPDAFLAELKRQWQEKRA